MISLFAEVRDQPRNPDLVLGEGFGDLDTPIL